MAKKLLEKYIIGGPSSDLRSCYGVSRKNGGDSSMEALIFCLRFSFYGTSSHFAALEMHARLVPHILLEMDLYEMNRMDDIVRYFDPFFFPL